MTVGPTMLLTLAAPNAATDVLATARLVWLQIFATSDAAIDVLATVMPVYLQILAADPLIDDEIILFLTKIEASTLHSNTTCVRIASVELADYVAGARLPVTWQDSCHERSLVWHACTYGLNPGKLASRW